GVQVAAGIIVAEDGIIATKSSELRDASNVAVFFGDGRSLPAEIIRQDDRNDVALLKVPARHLPVVNWSSAETAPGIFVLSPSADGSVYGLGSYSVIPRSTIVGQAAFLGVRPNLTIDGRGLLLSEITPDTAASRAGLRNGDVMLSFAGAAMNSVTDLHREVKLKSPGDTVDIQFRRNGVVTTTSATLAGRNISGNQAKEFRMMNRLGAIPSRRAGNFPVVFQHDSPMFPEQIGGPVVDLNGNVIGMNISRTGRTGCYAIPSATMQQLVDDLLRENVASRE
ncbi:MAG: trypsin-like peptidase domain-containing protein, partial [Planctomycetota bacterium]